MAVTCMEDNKKGGLGDKIKKAPPNLFNNKDAKKVVDGTIIIGSAPAARPKNIPQVPIPAAFSAVEPPKDYSRPAHYIGVDQNQTRHLRKNLSSIPTHVGSTYDRKPNNISGYRNDPPRSASVPKAYIPPHLSAFSEYTLLANRDATGRILGSHVRRYVDESKVPVGYVPPEPQIEDIPVGPDNPVKVLGNGTWSACWDESAAAVYYYNNSTGEADWILPEAAQQQLRLTMGLVSRPNTAGYQ